MPALRTALRMYLLAVNALAVLLVACTVVSSGADIGWATSASGWMLVALVLAGESWPLHVTMRGVDGVIQTSAAFAFALLLMHGPLVAMLALPLACLLADVRRLGLTKASFNASQYAISLGAGQAVLAIFGVSRFSEATLISPVEAVVVLGAGLSILVVNYLLTAVAIATAMEVSLLDAVRTGWRVDLSIASVLLLLAPALAVLMANSIALVPPLLVAVYLMYRGATIAQHNERDALQDPLTELANRRALLDHTQRALAAAAEHGHQVGMLVIDLDGFKPVNDTFGHHVGDEALCVVADRIAQLAGDEAVAARLGGDEFAVLLPVLTSARQMELLADALLTSIRTTVSVSGLTLSMDASVGGAIGPDVTSDPIKLVQAADGAMFAAKRAGSGFSHHDPRQPVGAPGRLELLADLQDAVERGELQLHFQPLADVGDGHVTGFEALLRWDHPERGAVPPGDFIPLAENSEIIGPVSQFVLQEAVAQCRRWHDAGHELSVSVNLGVRNLSDPELPAQIVRLLDAHRLPASTLRVEITENTILADPSRIIGVLNELRAVGVHAVIDDFGTGYSSLAHLREVPASAVKIDRTFLRPDDGRNRVIARAVSDLAHALGMHVVAEGVETPEDWRWLRTMGCDVAQGFLISAGIPAAGVIAWLEERDGVVLDQDVPVPPIARRRPSTRPVSIGA